MLEYVCIHNKLFGVGDLEPNKTVICIHVLFTSVQCVHDVLNFPHEIKTETSINVMSLVRFLIVRL